MNSLLDGITVLNTRPLAQAEALTELLKSAGARVIEQPMLELCPRVDREELQGKLHWLGVGNWLVFTSANGVSSVSELIDLSKYRIAAIGNKTAEALRDVAASAAFVSPVSNSEAFAESFAVYLSVNRKTDTTVPRILLLRGEIASEVLPKKLSASGCLVQSESVYTTTCPKLSEARWRELFEPLVSSIQNSEIRNDSGEPKLANTCSKCVCLFTSSQAGRNYVELLRLGLCRFYPELEVCDVLDNILAVAIGPKTGQVLAQVGFTRVAISAETSAESLVGAISGYFGILPG